MGLVLTWLLAVAAMMLAPLSAAWGQAPADACSLMSRGEFEALTGKIEYNDPTGMPWGGAMVCGFDNGQILIFSGENSEAAFDQLLNSFGQEGLPRTPVDGLGEGAFALFFDPEDEYQDHGTTVVFGAAPPTVAVTVYAADGEPPEAALQQAMAVAQAIAAKLP